MAEADGPSGTARYFRHAMALVESEHVGPGTRVWAFAHILPGARVGADCNVCDGVFVEGGAVVGDRVTLKCGVQVWDGVVLEDDVFVGPNATFTNDPFPRSRQHRKSPLRTVVRQGASIGANATILCGVTVGTHAMVGAGAVVTHDVPPNAIVVGNPASVSGYVDAPTGGAEATTPLTGEVQSVGVGGVTLRRLPKFLDLRGSLLVAEVGKQLPFAPRRVFVVHDVASRQVRGEHAHRVLHQFLVCLAGQCSVVVDDGRQRREITLDSATVGVHLPPMVWGTQYRFSPDAILLVLASEPYDPEDYIRDYEEFRKAVANG